MSPTFLESDQAIAVIGTPGGSRIINMVLLATLEITHGNLNVNDWVSLPRFHHQFLPDRVQYERGAFSEPVIKNLNKAGHQLQLKPNGYGNMQAVMWHKQQQKFSAASDPRGEGLALISANPIVTP